jgi:hypothetical protein
MGVVHSNGSHNLPLVDFVEYDAANTECGD